MYKNTNYRKILFIKALNILGLFNVTILLLRFFFKLYSANPSDLGTQIVYFLSTPHVAPYQLFLSDIALTGSSIFESASLVGLLVVIASTYLLNIGLSIWLTREGRYPYSPHMRVINRVSNLMKPASKPSYRTL